MVTSDGLVKIEGVSLLLATRGSGRARLGRRLFACVFSVRALLLLEKHWQGDYFLILTLTLARMK